MLTQNETSLRAYSNPKITKADFLAELREHQEADHFVQDYGYWTNGKGCALGCSIQSINVRMKTNYMHSDHAAYEATIGVPQVLAKLEDSFFEGLSVDLARQWPLRFAEAIPENADLSGVWSLFAIWLVQEVALPTIPKRFVALRAAVERVITGYANNWQNDCADVVVSTIYAAYEAIADDKTSTILYAATHTAAYAANTNVYFVSHAANTVSAAASIYATWPYNDIATTVADDTKLKQDMYACMADKLCELMTAAPVLVSA